LLKTTDNQPLTSTRKVITDGLGNDSALSLATTSASITGTLAVSSTFTASNLSGTNTGDETQATIKSKLGAATTSVDGYLTSVDWTTFNNKQNALTNPITGTGTANTLPKFSASTTLANSNITDNGTIITLGSDVSLNGNLFLNPANTANLVTSLFTEGSNDPNFKAGFSNGSGSAIGSEQAKVGMWYGTSGNAVCHLGFLRGDSTNSNGITFNVNNTERMRINELGNVGIGTTTPTEKLQVGSLGGGIKRILIPGTYNFDGAYLSNFDANGGAKLELVSHTNADTSASWRIANNNDSNGQALTFSYAGAQSTYGALSYASPSMLITSTGNVGIGTASPSYKLDVNGSSIFRSWSSMSAGFPFSWNSVDGLYVANGFASAINTETSDGAMAFFTAPSGSAGASASFTERMRITSTGNVGIGTQNPSNKLSVVGSGSFSTSLSVGSSLSVAGNSSFNGTLSVVNASTLNGSVLIGAIGDGDYRLRTDLGNVSILGELRVDSEGNILTYNSSGLNIGSLPITNATSIAMGGALSGATDITGSGKLSIANIGASGTLNVGSTTTATKRLELTADNNSGENNTLRFVDTDTTTNTNQVIGKIEFFSNDATAPGGSVKAYISAHSLDVSPDAYLDFATDQVTGTPIVRQRIQADGKVLFGTTTPIPLNANLVQVNGGLDYNIIQRASSGTAITLGLVDKGSFFETTSPSAISVTIPTNASVAFPIGTQIWFVQGGVGVPTFSGDTGVTLRTRSVTRQPFGRYAEVKLTKTNTDEWYLTGDLKA
jgi:hypothetical protein